MSYQTKGIDVSGWQGVINWPRVKPSGIEFAMIKATEGFTIKSDSLTANLTGAAQAGIHTGVYHFMHATNIQEVNKEANYFLSVIKGCKFEYPVALDVEALELQKLGKAALTNCIIAFLDMVAAAGYYPAIYTNLNWASNYIDMSKIKYDVWLAQYYDRCTYGKPVAMWQYSSEGRVAGIDASVDLDICYKDYPTIIRNLGLNGYSKAIKVTYSGPFNLDTSSKDLIPGELYTVLARCSAKPSVAVTGADKINVSAPRPDPRGWLIDVTAKMAGFAHISVTVGGASRQCNFNIK